jgi:hypothetical protein
VKIIIDIVDHKEQRYETVGDWQLMPDGILITVSKLGNIYKEVCIAIHELVEAVLCMHRGISQWDVDKFDKSFEEMRVKGSLHYTGEPGDAVDAPYKKEHFFATTLERLLVAELGIDWTEYERQINSL